MNCAIYIRKSREDKSKPAHRLTVQRQQLPDHARAQGWKSLIYDDGHASAARGKAEDLRERRRLEQDIRTNKIDVILCIELSRLSRDDSMQDYVAWLHLCSEHGVKLATTSRILDPAQPSDWMLLLMEGGFSSVEMRILKTRMEQGRAEAYRAGRWLSGNPPMPYLYDLASKTLAIDKAQLPKFNQLLRLAENHSAAHVAEQTGLPKIAVRRAIADDRLLIYQAKRIDPATGETIACQWPPVVTAEQAEKIRTNRRAGHHHPRRTITGLLVGINLFVCGYCGRAIRTWSPGRDRKDGTRLAYYGCRHLDKRGQCPGARMIPQHIVDQKVLANLANTLKKLDEIRSAWAAQKNAGSAEQLAEITSQIATNQQRRQRLIAAITEGVIDFASAKQKRLELDNEASALQIRQQQIINAGSTEINLDDLDITAEEVGLLTTEELRDLLTNAIEQISMTSSKLIITYKFPCRADGRKTSEIKLPPPGKHNPNGHWKIEKK